MAAVAPPSPEALIGALLALFSAGDLGKKLYSVLCRDIATVGKAQPFYQTERQEIQHLPRGARWREIRGEARCAQKNTGPSRQSAGASACAGGVSTARVRPRPLGAPGDVGRRREGAGASSSAAVGIATSPSHRGGNRCLPGTLARKAVQDRNISAGSRAQLRSYGPRKAGSLWKRSRRSWGLRALGGFLCRVSAPREHEWPRC